MKDQKLNNDFGNFQISNSCQIRGGLGGTVNGSSINQGRTYFDISWDDGSTSCDYAPEGGCNDSSGDNGYIGDRVIR